MMDIGSNSCFVTDASCLNVDHGYSIASSICNTPYFKTIFFFWNSLQDCIGAIDGTHIKAKIPAEHQRLDRGRKNECTHNVMAVCDFDMLFSYMYVDWEGTANDGCVFRDVIRIDQGFE
jgi:hypothetical protein